MASVPTSCVIVKPIVSSLGTGQLAAKVNAFRRLSWTDRGVLFQAVLLLPLVGLSVRLFSFRRVQAVLEHLPSPKRRAGGTTRDTRLDAARVAYLVDVASRHTLLPSTCLHRSLTLAWLLRCEGHHGSLHFGVRKLDGQFEAHSWVECDGSVVRSRDAIEHDYVKLRAYGDGRRT